MSIVAFAAVSVRRRKILSGSNGERERSSMTTNATTSAIAPPKPASVAGAAHPSLVARVVA